MLRRIRHSSLVGNKENDFCAYMSETDSHIMKKFEIWLKLRRAGYTIWCEPIFSNGIRFDLLAFKSGIFTGYEVLHTEKTKELAEKIKNYPDINIVAIKTDQDIKNLEMF